MPSKKITYLKYKKFGNRVEWDGIKIVVSKISSHKKQYGVIATKKLLKGTRIPYFGKMRKESSLTGKENYCYFMHLRKNFILDGNPKYEPSKGKNRDSLPRQRAPHQDYIRRDQSKKLIEVEQRARIQVQVQ